ncbi:MAG TPA: hypothetical protein VGN34_07490 [Ktedonobacteraceae bacterium]
MTPPIFRQKRLRLSQTLHSPPLEGLVGDWEMERSNAVFLPRPSDRVKGGPVLIEWVQDGAFLALRMGDKSPNPPRLSGS